MLATSLIGRDVQANSHVQSIADRDTAGEHVLRTYIEVLRPLFFQNLPFLKGRWANWNLWNIEPLRKWRNNGVLDKWAPASSAIICTYV